MDMLKLATDRVGDYLVSRAQAREKYEEDRARFANSPQMLELLDKQYDSEMAKGVAGVGIADVAASIPQDLDPRLQSLYAQGEPYGMNMLLKTTPAIEGAAPSHQYALQVTSGLGGTGGAAGEYSTGVFLKPRQELITSYLKWTKVRHLKSAAANMVRSIGDYSQQQAFLNHRRLVNQSLIYDNTAAQVGGTGGLRRRGVIQGIVEGTNGTDARIPVDGYNYLGQFGHTWDVKGQTFTENVLRSVPAELVSIWGNNANLKAFLPSKSISGLEAGESERRRHNNPLDAQFQGQMLSGLVSNGNYIPYIVEHDLNPFGKDNSRGIYSSARPDNAPSGYPTITPTAVSPGTGSSEDYSLFDANNYGAGTVYYAAAWFDGDDLLSAARLSDGVAVAEDEIVQLVISGVPANATSVRIWRCDQQYLDLKNVSAALAHSCWIMDVTPPGTGDTFTVYDYNVTRPYCGTGLILSVNTPMAAVANSVGAWDNFLRSKDFASVAPFMSQIESELSQNALRQVYVGPKQLTFQLANTLHTDQNMLIGSWCSLEVINPFVCGVIKNLPVL